MQPVGFALATCRPQGATLLQSAAVQKKLDYVATAEMQSRFVSEGMTEAFAV